MAYNVQSQRNTRYKQCIRILYHLKPLLKFCKIVAFRSSITTSTILLFIQWRPNFWKVYKNNWPNKEQKKSNNSANEYTSKLWTPFGHNLSQVIEKNAGGIVAKSNFLESKRRITRITMRVDSLETFEHNRIGEKLFIHTILHGGGLSNRLLWIENALA